MTSLGTLYKRPNVTISNTAEKTLQMDPDTYSTHAHIYTCTYPTGDTIKENGRESECSVALTGGSMAVDANASGKSATLFVLRNVSARGGSTRDRKFVRLGKTSLMSSKLECGDL